MFAKTFITGSALAAAANAATIPTAVPTTIPSAVADPACSSIQSGLPFFPTQSASASSFCSSYFRISTSTTVTTQTTTVSPTSTVYTATSTCVASPRGSNAKREAQFPTSLPALPNPNGPISSACSCIGVNFSPVATATRTSTVTAATSTVTTASTSTVRPQATYVAPGGTRFSQYYNTDFYGGDLVSSFCGANGQFQVSSTVSTPCTNFTTCENSCEAYNQANGGTSCVGVAYSRANTFCYLKSSVSCNVRSNDDVDSGLIQ